MRFFDFMRLLALAMALILFCSTMTFVAWAYARTEVTLTKIEVMADAYDQTKGVLENLQRK